MEYLAINPKITINKIAINEINAVIYVIDDFTTTIDLLIQYAKNVAYLNPEGADGTAYPGMRDTMPMPYLRILKKLIKQEIFPQFALNNPQVKIHRSLLSLTTTEEENLTTLQKMPHIDCFDNNEFATVHYLCGNKMAGTSIYKYLPKNIIKFNEEHHDILNEMKINVENLPLEHAGYLNGTTSIFKQILSIEAKPNRLVIYPGNLLHCANIEQDVSISTDIDKGRLTIASFFSVV